ncbi:putative nucleic acid-binding Zn ribbon protein [Pseudoclavibacter sp. JAI123]|uniref:DUF721 domain-containing protein n=1 Tax=Pseudoclavibacter sp. JAI123 TaxID=2723065 RepID=UPI0015CC6B33|nr:DciA family protein [Pseudoclavibacter sp. JAI123]NYF11893.1 putative nucleic acid-binding Zn ribbon protein [Pseudoclavibacter sp. JAI123]
MSEGAEVYARFKEVFGGKTTSLRRRLAAKAKDAEGTELSEPFGFGRDPVAAGSALAALTRQFGWNGPLKQAELMDAWPEIVGKETAAHSTPLHIEDGVLLVQCDSTAWATQLRGMQTMLLTNLAERYAEAKVERIRFLNPGAPSWKRGPRSVPGRGPRDTYG